MLNTERKITFANETIKTGSVMNRRLNGDRYENPYTDFGFKKLFGTEMNKELLISYNESLKVYRDWKEHHRYRRVERRAKGKL